MEKVTTIQDKYKLSIKDKLKADRAYNENLLQNKVVPFDNYRGSYYTINDNYYFPLSNRFNYYLKTSFDFIVSLILIITVLSWLIPVISLLIRLDSKGPVFFVQKRRKNTKQLFTCIKFRTMFINDEADLKAALVDDSRVTRIGKFLRHYHLDELPQLFNVLLGDMSIIGPRPYMIAEDDRYESVIEEYDLRYKVKPGITGLAQSLGEFGFTEDIQQMKDRVLLDILYAKKWSVWMDIKIVGRTFFEVLGFKFKSQSAQSILESYQ